MVPPALTVSREQLSQHAKRCQHDLLTVFAPLKHACHGADDYVHLQRQGLLQNWKSTNSSTLADCVSTALQQRRSKGLGLRHRSQQQHLRMLWRGLLLCIFCAMCCCSQGCATPLLGPPYALQGDPPSRAQSLRAAATRNAEIHIIPAGRTLQTARKQQQEAAKDCHAPGHASHCSQIESSCCSP